LPSEHLADQAYLSADLLTDSQNRYVVELVGPIRPNPSWQAKDEAAYDISRFEIDWDREVVTCPEGKESRYWKPARRAEDWGTIPQVAGALPPERLRGLFGKVAVYEEKEGTCGSC